MKRFFTLFALLTTATPLFAATADISAKEVFVDAAGVLFFLLIAAHMLFENLFRKRFKTNHTVEEFSAARTAPMSQQQAEEIEKSLDSIDDIWGEIFDSNGDMVCYPHSRAAFRQSVEIVERAVAANPTKKSVVNKINEYNEILNHAQSRQFNGSKSMIVIAVVLSIVIGIIVDAVVAIVSVGAGIVLYLLASRTPNFMLISQLAESRESSKSPLSRILSSLFMGVATSKSHKQKITLSDGTKTTKTDRTETWLSVLLAIVVTLLLSFLLPLISIVNYIRNYVIYK